MNVQRVKFHVCLMLAHYYVPKFKCWGVKQYKKIQTTLQICNSAL